MAGDADDGPPVHRGQKLGLSGHDGDTVNEQLLPSSAMRVRVKSSESADEPAISMIMLG